MRLIVNFNRPAFEQYGFDGYDRAEIDSNGPEQVMLCLAEGGEDWMAFSPCNDGIKAKDGERERYKIRVPVNKAEDAGLEGSARYTVEDDSENPGFFFLKKHSLIIASQPESYEEPMASVSFTEVEMDDKAREEAIRRFLVGGDSKVIMNTLRLQTKTVYGHDGCWLKGNGNEPSVCHIRPWNTGGNMDEQRDLLLDVDNVWLLRPDLHVRFAKGDFTVNDSGDLVFAQGIDPVADCGFSQRVIDLGKDPGIMFGKLNRNNLTDEMKEYFRWHRRNVFKG